MSQLNPSRLAAFAQQKDRSKNIQSAYIDGELVLIDPRGAAPFYRLMAKMRMNHPDEAHLMFTAFDLLHQDGVDLRGLPYPSASATRLCVAQMTPTEPHFICCVAVLRASH